MSFQIPGAQLTGPSFGGLSPGVGGAGAAVAGASVDVYNVGGPGTVDYEKLSLFWNANLAEINAQRGGAGPARSLRINAVGTVQLSGGNTAATLTVGNGSSAAEICRLNMGSGMSVASGLQTGLAVSFPIAQSGSAGYTALDVNPTENSTGSGTKLLQRWAVGGSQVASLGSNGAFALGSGGAAHGFDVQSGKNIGLPISSTSVDLTLNTVFTLTVDASGGARIITLPAASQSTRRIYTIKKIDASANTVTIDANAAETIDGAVTQVLTAQWQAITIQCDGTAWFIIGKV